MDQQETIKLPIAVLSGLYNNCLVDLKNPDPTSKVPASESTETLAGLPVDTVVVSLAEGKELPSQQLEFLNNIMKACKLEQADYAIITNKQNELPDYKAAFSQFKQKQLILFGIAPADIGLPINFPHFQVQSFQQVRYLAAPKLDVIEADKALKMQLWQCLKQLFLS
jgi:hypothetical protein